MPEVGMLFHKLGQPDEPAQPVPWPFSCPLVPGGLLHATVRIAVAAHPFCLCKYQRYKHCKHQLSKLQAGHPGQGLLQGPFRVPSQRKENKKGKEQRGECRCGTWCMTSTRLSTPKRWSGWRS